MSDFSKTWLIETEELERELDAPDFVIIDASWHMPSDGRDARKEYLEEHIPGALFFDIDEIADTKSPLPHMLPPPEKFSSRMRSMGIGDGSRIVVYDSKGLFSAARVWWTFRVMGVQDVSVLNGGLPKWKREGHPLESGEPRIRTARHFTARRNADLVRDLADMKALVKDKSAEIVDARAPDRFAGRVAEPRPGLRSGHIPGAHNLAYARLTQQGRHAQIRARAREAVRGGRCRFEQAGGDELRLRHHRERSCLGACRDRQPAHLGLRRRLGRVGR